MPAKSILITGCSSGIGLAAAEILKARGYRVFASARKQADVEKLQAAGFESLKLDVNHPTSIREALDHILTQTGGTLDALFNNAGYMQAGALEDMSDTLDRAQMETNFFGPIQLTRAVLPIMRQQGHGRIVQNSSILGVITMPYYGAYNASKHALEAYSLTLRQELRGTSIHVSLINPGPILSELRKSAHHHYQQVVQNQQSGHHATVYKKMEESYFKPGANRLALEPKAVVDKLIHALESKHPNAHYFIGTPAKFMAIMKRLLPDNAFNWLIATIRKEETS